MFLNEMYYLRHEGYVFGLVSWSVSLSDYLERDLLICMIFLPEVSHCVSGKGTIDYILGMIRITLRIMDPDYDH